MKIGRWRHRVTIQVPATSDDGYGQQVVTWTSYGPYWSEVQQISGRESRVAEQLRADATHQITMRAVRTVDHSMRLLYGASVLNVLSADLDARGRYLTIVCQERLSGN